MDAPLTLLGIELIVDDLDRAIELFTDVLGCPLLSRGASTLVAGETAAIDLGSIVVNLLAPDSVGEGTVLAERTPRFSQFILSQVVSRGVAEARTRSVERGLAVVPLDATNFYLTPESVEGALGQAVAVIVTGADDA
jgi:catechol 2,3-dioxygenase-like lactoylglutathione lyase family enzyme